MLKKVLSICLTLAMLASAAPLTGFAYALEDVQDTNETYISNEETAEPDGAGDAAAETPDENVPEVPPEEAPGDASEVPAEPAEGEPTDGEQAEEAPTGGEPADGEEAGEPEKPEEPAEIVGASSDAAPEGYQPVESMDEFGPVPFALTDEKELRVLLIQDTLPWSSNANEVILNRLNVPYDKVTSQDFISKVDLTQYGVVIFANDQRFSAYENYEEFKEYLTKFAEVGGVIVFGACDNGWADGALTADLPGGVEKGPKCYTHYNHISVEDGGDSHPIVTGELSDGTPILDEDLVGTYCSHAYFIENTLPAGSRVILRDSTNNAPTLVEYPLENGRVIASGLTWEFSYDHVGEILQGGYRCGDYAVKNMDDLFLYAIRVSNIQVDELHRLEEYRLNANAHHIIVSDQDSTAIPNATVNVDGTDYTTDENGSVAIHDFGKKTVKISAAGYQTLELTYTMQEKTARVFFLTKADSLKLPYITSLQETSKEYDFLSQKVYYPQGKDQSATIKMTAEWQGKTPAEYVLFQTDENGTEIAKLVSNDGTFTVSPGKVFQPGYAVKACLYAADGTRSRDIRTGIVVQANRTETEDGPVENLTKFKLFEDATGNLNDSKATMLLPDTWSVSVDQLPVEVGRSYDPEDGSTTFKVVIGLAGGEWTKDLLDGDGDDEEDSPWWTFKKKFEDAKELYSSREKLLEEFEDKLADSKLTSQFSAKLEALGYVEVKRNAFGDVIKTSGGLIVKGGGSYNLGGTFLAGPVPLYYEIGFGANFDSNVGLKLTCVDKNWNLGLEGNLSITVPEITLGGGLGVYGVAQGGIEGTGGLEIGIAPKFTGTLKASASIKIKVLFLAEFKWQIGNEGKWQLWPNSRARAFSFDELYDTLADENVTLEPVSNAYAAKTTPWNSTGTAIAGSSAVALQDWVMPDTMPTLNTVDGQVIALFQSNKDGLVKLVYSCYDDSTGWSEPKPVSADGTDDLFFQTGVTSSGDLYVIWQKLSAALGSRANTDETVAEAAANSEIYVAAWNRAAKSFDAPQRLTNNTSMDMLPTLYADENGTLIAAWVNDPSNTAIGSRSTCSLQYSTHTGAGWSAGETLTSSLPGGVADIAVMGNASGSNVEACYIVDGTVYSTRSGERLSNAGEKVGGLSYSGSSITWCGNGTVYEYGPDGKVSAVEGTVGGNYVVKNNGARYTVWAVNETENEQPCGVLYADVQNSETPVKLVSLPGYSIAYFDVERAADGTWYAMVDAVSTVNGESKTSLIAFTADSLCDIALDYVYADESKRTGDNQPVEIAVVNNGEAAVTAFDLTITGDGVNYNGTVDCSAEPIAPGARKSVDVNLDVSGVTRETTLTASVDMPGDTNSKNNVNDKTVIGRVDAAVELESYFTEDSIVVTAKVSNKGHTTLNAAIKVIDTANNYVLQVKNLGRIEPNEFILSPYEFSLSGIDFENQSSKNYEFLVEVGNGENDYNELNNSDIAIIYADGYVPEEPDDPTPPTPVDPSVPTVPDIDLSYLWHNSYEISVPRRVTGGTVTVRSDYALYGDTVTLTVTPEAGYELDYVRVTDSRNRELTLRDRGNGKYSFTMPASLVYVDAAFAEIVKETPAPAPVPSADFFADLGTPGLSGITLNPAYMPFIDVGYGDWYYSSVEYMWKHYLMSGVSDTKFSPASTTSRAMIWTILARMNKVRTDLNPGATWYERGKVWSMERGLTDGTNPMGEITREQLATMLWRNAGSPYAAADLSQFSDSGDVSGYASTAVRWAVANGILNGSDGRLNPQGTATRAQVAAMVMRYGERIGG